MPINQRRHIRFSLDIPADISIGRDERRLTVIQQISVGGCFVDFEDDLYPGDEFRLEVELPNGSRLPLICKCIYRFEGSGIGARFVDMTRFELDLLGTIIRHHLELQGLPFDVDPFETPSTHRIDDDVPTMPDARRRREHILETVMSGEEN